MREKQQVAARMFPLYLKHALEAVVVSTSPRRTLTDVAGFCLREGAHLLMLLPGMDEIRRCRDVVLQANDTLAILALDEGWADVKAGPAGARNQKFATSRQEHAAVAALDRLIGLGQRPGVALCCMAALCGMAAVPEELRVAMRAELKRFRQELNERVVVAQTLAAQAKARGRPRPMGCAVSFDDVLADD